MLFQVWNKLFTKEVQRATAVDKSLHFGKWLCHSYETTFFFHLLPTLTVMTSQWVNQGDRGYGLTAFLELFISSLLNHRPAQRVAAAGRQKLRRTMFFVPRRYASVSLSGITPVFGGRGRCVSLLIMPCCFVLLRGSLDENIYFSAVVLNELPATLTGSTQDPIRFNVRTIILPSPLTLAFGASPTSRTVGRVGEKNLIPLLLPINCRLNMSDQTPVYSAQRWWKIRSLPPPSQSEDTGLSRMQKWKRCLDRAPPFLNSVLHTGGGGDSSGAEVFNWLSALHFPLDPVARSAVLCYITEGKFKFTNFTDVLIQIFLPWLWKKMTV